MIAECLGLVKKQAEKYDGTLTPEQELKMISAVYDVKIPFLLQYFHQFIKIKENPSTSELLSNSQVELLRMLKRDIRKLGSDNSESFSDKTLFYVFCSELLEKSLSIIVDKNRLLCMRCGKDASSKSASYLNTDMICSNCKEGEKLHPLYRVAKEKEEQEIRNQNYNYPGLFAGKTWDEIKEITEI